VGEELVVEEIWPSELIFLWLAFLGAPHLCAGLFGLIRQRPPIWSTRSFGMHGALLWPILLNGWGVFSPPFTAGKGFIVALMLGSLIWEGMKLWAQSSYTVYGTTHAAAEGAFFAALDKLELKDEARSGSRTMYIAGEYFKIVARKPYLGFYSIRTRGRGGRQLLEQVADVMAQSLRAGQVGVSKKLLALNVVYGLGLGSVGLGFWIYWASRITQIAR